MTAGAELRLLRPHMLCRIRYSDSVSPWDSFCFDGCTCEWDVGTFSDEHETTCLLLRLDARPEFRGKCDAACFRKLPLLQRRAHKEFLWRRHSRLALQTRESPLTRHKTRQKKERLLCRRPGLGQCDIRKHIGHDISAEIPIDMRYTAIA